MIKGAHKLKLTEVSLQAQDFPPLKRIFIRKGTVEVAGEAGVGDGGVGDLGRLLLLQRVEFAEGLNMPVVAATDETLSGALETGSVSSDPGTWAELEMEMVSGPGALGAETDNSGDSSADGPGPEASSTIAKERSGTINRIKMYKLTAFLII